MTQPVHKPTLSRRFFAWLVSLVVGFIARRIMKRLGASTQQSKQEKRERKYVKNKADK